MIKRTDAVGAISLVALGAMAMGCGEQGAADETLRAALTGQMPVAFQGASNVLWIDQSGPGTGFGTSQPMKPGTVPSFVTDVGGTDVGYQGSNGNFWDYSNGTPTDSHGAMQAGTSPSITHTTWGTFGFGFHGINGNLWYGTNGLTSGVDTHHPMASGTSPSVSANGLDAYHGANGNFWVGSHDTHGTMAVGTNPSITDYDPTGAAFAFQGINGHLWFGTDPSGDNGFDTQQAMRSGTSPSVTAGPFDKTAYVAFQTNTGVLNVYYYRNNAGGVIHHNNPMAAGASPIIQIGSDTEYEVAFKGSNGDLWIVMSSGGPQDQGYRMN
jgi:hypothetical protein